MVICQIPAKKDYLMWEEKEKNMCRVIFWQENISQPIDLGMPI